MYLPRFRSVWVTERLPAWERIILSSGVSSLRGLNSSPMGTREAAPHQMLLFWLKMFYEKEIR